MSFDLRAEDCVDGMKSLIDGSVDHVICDPPYSVHVHGSLRSGASLVGGGGGKGDYRAPISRTKTLDFDPLDKDVRIAVSRTAARLCRRWVIVFSDIENCHLWRSDLEDSGLQYVRTAFWHKIGGAPQFTGDRPAVACEAVTIAHPRGRKKWNGGGKQGIYSFPIVSHAGESARHPTQKPLALMEAIVRDFTDPGDLILDPFAGSGTTGVAAIRLGRRFIGFERDPKYHAIATKRLTVTREQLGLFAEGA